MVPAAGWMPGEVPWWNLMTDREFCEALRLSSDRICNLILHADLDWVDIEIQINNMRDFCRLHSPSKMELFEMVYASRFLRIRDAWQTHCRSPQNPTDD